MDYLIIGEISKVITAYYFYRENKPRDVHFWWSFGGNINNGKYL